MQIRKIISLFIFTGLIALMLYSLESCSPDVNKTESLPSTQKTYLNLHDSTNYVGKETCKECHTNKYETYIHTEMGRSFKNALVSKSAADFGSHSPIYDEHSNLYYLPFTKNDSIYLHEFRLKEGDTTHSRIEKIDFIIGSGQHTNSHFIQQNGYLYQAPFTFYAQKKEWHLPPGFENGANTRFSRIIGQECMTCHNGFAIYKQGSKNKFSEIPEGIDCERCHGPGEIHVSQKKDGKFVNTTKEIDYSIVNPGKLSADLQMDVCQRCHLQGISVLQKGKTHFDFKPGLPLHDFVNVFQARFKDSSEAFIMASHPDRLRMSNCFVESRKQDFENPMTCITCHNPHVSVKDVDDSYFNSKCSECHQVKKCSEKSELKSDDNCVACHMKKASTYDIPHVNITDHNITKRPQSRDVNKADFAINEIDKQDQFVNLVCRTTHNIDALTKAKAYLNYFEKYAPHPMHLATAEDLLKNYKLEDTFDEHIRLYFLRTNYNKVIEFSNTKSIGSISDSWTAYRIGQSYYHLKNYSKSIEYLEKAHLLAPYDIDFLNKLASSYFESGNYKKALECYRKSYSFNSKIAETNNSLGYTIVVSYFNLGIGNLAESEKYFKNAILLDPDFKKAKENLCSFYINSGNKEEATKLINELIELEPTKNEYLQLKAHIEKL